MMKVAIMQPYVFPYIGYFQLINAVDQFVLFDDVQFIKRGWVNRNRLLAGGKEVLFSIPLEKAHQTALINERKLSMEQWPDARRKLLKLLEREYGKAPFFNQVYPLVENSLNCPGDSLLRLIHHSLLQVNSYLGVATSILFSSSVKILGEYKNQERIIALCRHLGATEYVNPIGGSGLYERKDFAKNALRLSFLKSNPVTYKQGNEEFVPCLSVIDVMMFNSVERIREYLGMYELV